MIGAAILWLPRPSPQRGLPPMADSEIDSIRELLKGKARPVGWAERRKRIEEVCAVWPVAGDIALEAVDVDGLKGEWSIAPESDASRVLLYFHGSGYCSGSIVSHRRMVTEAGRAAGVRTLAVGYRLAPEHPFPANGFCGSRTAVASVAFRLARCILSTTASPTSNRPGNCVPSWRLQAAHLAW